MRVLIPFALLVLVAAKPGTLSGQDPPEPPIDDLFEYRNPDFTPDGHQLFESDMVLTEDQRSGRQAASNLWTSPVHFAISSTSAGDRDAILAGIQQWRDHTCIEFNEVSEGSSTYHINVIKSSGCWSYVGRINFSSGKQDLSIGNGCTGLGTVVHEFGHAMGLNHQQSRTDRDTYVEILFDNVQTGREGNFAIASSSVNHSVPYDLTSVMHYGDLYFSKNGRRTIRVRDPLYEHLIGSRDGFSHRDKQIANIMYNCAAGCASPPTCQNGGFVDKTCTCVCPPNTSGSLCETATGDYYRGYDCGDVDMTAPGTISTPNYPFNYPASVDCLWWIKAPAGQQVRLTVTDMVLYPRLTDGSSRCYFSRLQLRYSGSAIQDDQLACGSELTGQTFTSTGSEFLVRFYSGCCGLRKGFTATVEFIGDAATTAAPTTAAPTTAAPTTAAPTTAAPTTVAPTTAAPTTAAPTTVAPTTAAPTTAAPTTSPGGNCGGLRRRPPP